MLNLSLAAISRGEARAQWEIPLDDALWEGSGLALLEPVRVEVEARDVGESGVLVRGRIRTRVQAECRRCLSSVVAEVDEPIDLLFEQVDEDAKESLAGEVYPLPSRGAELNLSDPEREQVLLHAPDYLLCREECRGLCPKCGANRNEISCECAPEEGASPWAALKNIKFD